MSFPKGAAYESCEKRWGGPVAHRESVVSVLDVHTELVQNFPDRVSLTFCNVSDTDIYIATTTEVSTARGIRVAAGGSVSLDVYEDALLPALQWYAVAAAAGGKDVYILEAFRVRVGG